MPKDDTYLAATPPSHSRCITEQKKYQTLKPIRLIGRGSFSSVYLSTDSMTGEELAVKVMDLRRFEDEFNAEVSVLMSLSHQGIDVGYKSSEIDEDNETGYIYMNYFPFPTLAEYLEQACCGLPEHEAFAILQNLIKAVENIHSCRIAHKDLKPDNIFIDPDTDDVTLIDFGLSSQIHDNQLDNSFSGSPLYMPPEVLNRESYDPVVADVWSLGVILYEMLIGSNPWSAAENLEELIEIVSQIDYPSFLSNDAVGLLTGMLAFQPSRRDTLPVLKKKVSSLI
jgi:serine/threonine protein kinase